MQYYTPEEISSNQHKLPVLGDPKFKEVLANIIYMLPKDILNDVFLNCKFFMLNDELHAAYFIPNKVITKKSIIALPGGFYLKDRDKQTHLIFHEIAHYILGHIDEGQPEEEIIKEEKEANALAEQWINDWDNHFWKSVAESKKPWDKKGGD